MKNSCDYFKVQFEKRDVEIQVTNNQIYANTVGEYSQSFYAMDCFNSETEVEECLLFDSDCPHEALHDLFQR